VVVEARQKPKLVFNDRTVEPLRLQSAPSGQILQIRSSSTSFKKKFAAHIHSSMSSEPSLSVTIFSWQRLQKVLVVFI
jgi:hypothetical protein